MKECDLDALLHPARAFRHPNDVVRDTDLTLNEKRAILASWASDACAVEAAPALRTGPAGPAAQFDEVMDALRELDKIAGAIDTQHLRRNARRQAVFGRPRGDGGRTSKAFPRF